MTIQHRDIPDAQRHEPKGISLATNKQIYHANGSGSGAWRQSTEDDVNYADKTKNKFGWNDIADSLYTSGSPLAIAATTRTAITNNGLRAQTDISRLGAIWNTASNAFIINDLNAFYNLRVQFKVKAAAVAGTPYTLKIEIESASGPTIFAATDQAIKGGSYENSITFNTGFYIGSVLNNQQLKLYVTPDTAITLYDIGFVIKRSYKEL